MSRYFVKDKDDLLSTYQIDWSDWLAGDLIQNSIWLAPALLQVDNSSHTSTAASITISGGTLGDRHNLTNRILTRRGRTADRTIVVRIVDL